MTVIARSEHTFRMHLRKSVKFAVLQDARTSDLMSEKESSDSNDTESRRIPGSGPTELADTPVQHYSLVLNDSTKPLEEFKEVKELLQVFYDAIKVHHIAVQCTNVLHRDISPSTIITLEPSQLALVSEIWMRVKETHPTSSEADQDEILAKELIDEELQGAAPARWLSDNQWALKLFSKVFATTSPAEWESGGGNIQRISEISLQDCSPERKASKASTPKETGTNTIN